MKDDLFNYIVTPTDKQYRAVNIIDEILGIPQLKIPNVSYFISTYEYLINGAIVNYNNEIIVAKTFYANMEKYHSYFEKKKKEEYDFWSRKYAEQLIKELYSIYDKSIHIINFLYDMKIVPDFNFKKNVRDKLKEIDKPFYIKMNSIYRGLHGNNSKSKNVIRNDITHNISNLFVRYVPKYIDGKSTGWYVEEPLPYNEFKKIIDDICNLLIENKQEIINKISEMYPKKGTAKYNEKRKETQEKYKKFLEEHNIKNN